MLELALQQFCVWITAYQTPSIAVHIYGPKSHVKFQRCSSATCDFAKHTSKQPEHCRTLVSTHRLGLHCAIAYELICTLCNSPSTSAIAEKALGLEFLETKCDKNPKNRVQVWTFCPPCCTESALPIPYKGKLCVDFIIKEPRRSDLSINS